MERRRISAKAIMADIRAGLPDTALKQKHGLSDKQLQTVLGKLVENGVLTQDELDNWRRTSTQPSMSDSTAPITPSPKQDSPGSGGHEPTPKESIGVAGAIANESRGTDQSERTRDPGEIGNAKLDVPRESDEGAHFGSRIRLYLLLLAVPLVTLGVAFAIQSSLTSHLREAASKQGASPEIVKNLSLRSFCEAPLRQSPKICSLYQRTQLMITGACVAILVGLAMIAAIAMAGRFAQSNRMALLVLFRPGLYATLIVVAALMLLHATLAVGTLYHLTSFYVGRIFPVVMLGIGFGALLGVARMVMAGFSMVQRAEASVLGRVVTRQQAPNLWNAISELAKKLNTAPPRHIVVGLDTNFFVTEADVLCLDGRLAGRTLYCSLPFCRILTTGELNGIIGHELGHFKGLDTQFSQKFFPVYRGTVSSITALQEVSTNAYRSIALLPAFAVLTYFLESFALAESNISRQRELSADQEGVAASSRQEFASALVKVHAFSGAWALVEQSAFKAISEGGEFRNASQAFEEFAAANAMPELLGSLDSAHIAHPTDSHPPFSVRMKALGMTLTEVSTDALRVQQEHPAITLIPDAEVTERDLSGVHLAQMASILKTHLPFGTTSGHT